MQITAKSCRFFSFKKREIQDQLLSVKKVKVILNRHHYAPLLISRRGTVYTKVHVFVQIRQFSLLTTTARSLNLAYHGSREGGNDSGGLSWIDFGRETQIRIKSVSSFLLIWNTRFFLSLVSRTNRVKVWYRTRQERLVSGSKHVQQAQKWRWVARTSFWRKYARRNWGCEVWDAEFSVCVIVNIHLITQPVFAGFLYQQSCEQQFLEQHRHT